VRRSIRRERRNEDCRLAERKRERRQARRKGSKNAVYDLELVNPHRKAEVDRRTPTDLLDVVEAKGREVAEALAALRTKTQPD